MVRDDPAREVYQLATRRFGNDDIYLIALESDDAFAPEQLETLRAIGQRVARLPYVRRAESLINAHDFRYDREAGYLDVGRLVSEIPRNPTALAALRERALTDPVYPKQVVSRDGRTAAINVSFRRVTDREFLEADLDARIRAIVAEEARSGQHFYFTGRPHVKTRAYELMVQDMLRLTPLAILAAALTTFLLTRSWRMVLLPLSACLTATLWTFAVLAWLEVPLNLVTIVLGPTLIALGGLYGIHVLGRFDVERQAGGSALELALRTLRYARLPVLVAGATTCVGFGALLLAHTLATSELGLFALFGVAALTLISLTGIPAVLALLPVGSGATVRGLHLDRLFAGWSRIVARRPTLILLVWLVVLASAIAALRHVVVDTDYLTFFDRGSQVRRDFAAIHHLLMGPVPLYVILDAGEEGAFREPGRLRKIESLQRRLEKLPAVHTTLSMVEPIRKLNRHLEGDDPTEERIPDSREAVSDLVFLIPKNQLRRFATPNHSAANIAVRTGELGSRAVRALETEIHSVLSAAEAKPDGAEAAVTGNAIVLNRSADRVALDQFRCVGFASLAIFVLLASTLRSARLGLLAMIPNWVPVLLFFGILGAGAAPLSLPTGLIGSLSLGVAIDDTVHLLVSYRRQRAKGTDPDRAIAGALQQVGRPLVITSVMLIAGFLVLTVSGFATIREFGLLTALTMALCLATDLALLPPLLARARL